MFEDIVALFLMPIDPFVLVELRELCKLEVFCLLLSVLLDGVSLFGTWAFVFTLALFVLLVF
jgi:hypothetical protein